MRNAQAITVHDASLSYHNNVLFNQLNLTIAANKITCLLGKSGVGKSSLLRFIAGLVIEDKLTELRGTISYEMAEITNQIAYMAQTDLLLPWLNALDNATLGFRLRNTLTADRLRCAKDLFSQLELQDCLKKFPRELSGGMRQRVALIRTLLEDRPIVLMDEPFSNLDAITRFQMQNLAVTNLRGKTVLMVTHDPMEALRMADTIIILGGTPASITTEISLTSSTPRNLSDADVSLYQEQLYKALTDA